MSTLAVSKPVAQTPWMNAEAELEQIEQRVTNEVMNFFPQYVANIITQYAVEIPSCTICLRDIAYPVILGCGHLFDLDCISDWARHKNTCPIDRSTIDVEKIRYAEGVIKKVSAVFNFWFLSDSRIDPIAVNVYSSVQRLKSLVSLGLSIRESNLITAAFSPQATKHPRIYSLIVGSGSESSYKAIKLYSDSFLNDNEIVKPGLVCRAHIPVKRTYFCCDRCYTDPEKEPTCTHPDEDEATAI